MNNIQQVMKEIEKEFDEKFVEHYVAEGMTRTQWNRTMEDECCHDGQIERIKSFLLQSLLRYNEALRSEVEKLPSFKSPTGRKAIRLGDVIALLDQTKNHEKDM